LDLYHSATIQYWPISDNGQNIRDVVGVENSARRGAVAQSCCGLMLVRACSYHIAFMAYIVDGASLNAAMTMMLPLMDGICTALP
jgi:hypothetical protein